MQTSIEALSFPTLLVSLIVYFPVSDRFELVKTSLEDFGPKVIVVLSSFVISLPSTDHAPVGSGSAMKLTSIFTVCPAFTVTGLRLILSILGATKIKSHPNLRFFIYLFF